MRNQLPRLVDSLPRVVNTFVHRLEHGTLPIVRRLEDALTTITNELSVARRTLRWTVAGSGMVITASVLATFGAAPDWLAIACAVIGAGCWVRAWIR
jgi:hypothetical protein